MKPKSFISISAIPSDILYRLKIQQRGDGECKKKNYWNC